MEEQIYTKWTQIKQIIERPDMYISSTSFVEQLLWINSSTTTNDKLSTFEQKDIQFCPGLNKIFDEILINASDNYYRNTTNKLAKFRTKTIKVNFVKLEQNEYKIEVINDGRAIPIKKDDKEGIFIPEMIFGHLLTSSSYDRKTDIISGGKFGFGAKLTNIFSRYFELEVHNSESKDNKECNLKWENFELKKTTLKAEHDFAKTMENYVYIGFIPNLKIFPSKVFSRDMLMFLEKRVYDLAGILHDVDIYLNNRLIKFDSFSDYCKLYDSTLVLTPLSINNYFEIIVGVSSESEKFREVSFVNSLSTYNGGRHIEYLRNLLFKEISSKKKYQKITKPSLEKYIFLFVNSWLLKPEFSSQTKEELKNAQTIQYEFKQADIKKLMDNGLDDILKNDINRKEESKIQKAIYTKRAKHLDILKLEDANKAGTKESQKCSLILTEGLSAKGSVMSGISVVSRDYYGIYPLKGKILNVRNASVAQIANNEEVQNIIRILGIEKTLDKKKLRYGRVIIMSDQDVDGISITGLIINIFVYFWPDLIRENNFLYKFITPIITATPISSKKDSKKIMFFSDSEFITWKKSSANEIGKYKIKYLKGLGSNEKADMIEYFKNLPFHIKEFVFEGETDFEKIDFAFNKKRADDRKDWLAKYDPTIDILYNKIDKISYTDFVDKSLIHFSFDDNIRTIPSIFDGFKESQRKIFYGAMKKKIFTTEIKVAQLSGYISEHTAYHHGENSLMETIIRMAQDFVGSNNINLFVPIGNFGSRFMGGEDAASARYIYTKLHEIVPLIFIPDDEHVMEYNYDDETRIEPKFYIPIIPFVLVNGQKGIGVGWSTEIPCYNYRQIIELFIKILESIIKKVSSKDEVTIEPYYRGFTGKIIKTGTGIVTYGIAEKMEKQNIIVIRELPIGVWTTNYKVVLEKLITDGKITNYKDYNSNDVVHFELSYNNPIDLTDLNLSKSISTTNMILFDTSNKLRKFDTIKDIITEFFKMREKYYAMRKKYLITKLQRELAIVDNKLTFLISIIKKELDVHKKMPELYSELRKKKFTEFNNLPKIESTIIDFEYNSDSFEYLVKLPIKNMTEEKISEYTKNQSKIRDDLKDITDKSVYELWLRDLINLRDYCEKHVSK